MHKFLYTTIALVLTACASAPMENTVPSQMPASIAAQVRALGRVVDPPGTEKIYAPLAQTTPSPGVVVERDIRYGGDSRNRLDVFSTAAANDKGKPVLIFVHGGAFIRGDKHTAGSAYYDNIMWWAVRNGFVGVNMTYRLAPQHPWPAAQQDIAAALRWVQNNIGQRGGNPQGLFLMGHSAGAAHVAQYLGHPEFYVSSGSGLRGAIVVSGLFDPASAEDNPPLRAYFGNDRTVYGARSALAGMAKAGVPILMAHAELDPPDFHQQAKLASSYLCQAGQCPTQFTLAGHSHMSEIDAINTDDHALTDAIRSFVAAHS